VEAGETVTQAARRELWEESGALRYTLSEAFDYKAGDEHGSATGRVFFAEIETLGPIPESEMAETALFDDLPVAITYPGILPELWAQPSTQEFFWKKSELKSAFLLPVLAGGFFIFRRFLPGNSANVLENHLFHQNQQKGRRMCRGISDVLMHGQTIESGKGLCYDKGG